MLSEYINRKLQSTRYKILRELKVHIPNPHEGDISRHLLSEILRQAGISPSE